MKIHEFKKRAHEILGDVFYDAGVFIDSRDQVEWRVTWAGMNHAKAGTPEQVLKALDQLCSGDKPTEPGEVEL
jgi:hypothetical protein